MSVWYSVHVKDSLNEDIPVAIFKLREQGLAWAKSMYGEKGYLKSIDLTNTPLRVVAISYSDITTVL